MDRLKDQEIGTMWVKNYPRRREESSWLLLTALVNIIKGNCLVIASKDSGNYQKTLEVSLRQCKVPAHEFAEIEKLKSPKAEKINPKRRSL